MCREQGAFAGTNYLNPPTGTHAYGVEGYKPIAREIFDHCGLPTDVIVPTARGDLLWGVLLGWQALHRQGLIPRLPRMHAVEPYARLSRALQTGDARGLWEAGTDQYSIAGGTTTLQSLQALARSGGLPVEVSDAAAAGAAAAGTDGTGHGAVLGGGAGGRHPAATLGHAGRRVVGRADPDVGRPARLSPAVPRDGVRAYS